MKILKILAAGMAFFLGAAGTAVKAGESVDYPRAMVDLICGLKNYAEEKHPGFGLLGNGGAGLFLEQDGNTGENVGRLLQALDGDMAESVNFRWDTSQRASVQTDAEDTCYFHRALAPASSAGMPVFSLDYVDSELMAMDSYRKNQEKGYIGWASFRRELDALPEGKPHKVNDRDITDLTQVQNYLVLLNPGKFVSKEAYLEGLRKTDYDLLIIDLFYGPAALTAEETASLKQKAGGGRRLVYAYMSVGEAETYRYYWQPQWSDDLPDWLAEANADWENNFKVKYWRPEWQAILYGSEEAYLDKIISAGFDGAFLDVMDAYYYYVAKDAERQGN